MVAKNFVGNAATTTLSAGISSGDMSFSVAAGSSYPAANFNIVIDKGLAGEEKVFITSRSGNTFTVGTRGDDNTTAAAHSSGAAVQHVGFAEDFQENNDHINASTNVHGLTGGAAVVGTTSTQTLTGKTLTAPVIADFTNANHTHASAAQGGVLPITALASAGASTTYTPVIDSGITVGNGTLTGRYKLLAEKFVLVQIDFVAGSSTTYGGAIQFKMPSGYVPVGSPVRSIGGGYATIAGNEYEITARALVSGGAGYILPLASLAASPQRISGASTTNPAAWDTSSSLSLTILIEVA